LNIVGSCAVYRILEYAFTAINTMSFSCDIVTKM